ncbi:hypothetical protein OS493_011432 [Desmophyllum pertusum]|uniref:Uncharacterized protein n=1 Tax=Desmophyllum pertusum TaxID=174260 RepID=A0A9W9YTH8_9CNID|nr:hypothetical protein OS493_011432 [Desmophyllum pertusum]
MLEEARRLSLGFEEIPLNDETPVTSAELCENEAASLPELAKESQVQSLGEVSGTNLASSKCSGREKRRILEEAKLKIDVLEEKQYLERRMEEEEAELKKKELQIEEERLKRKAEWSRKMEMLEVELEMKKATMDRIL